MESRDKYLFFGWAIMIFFAGLMIYLFFNEPKPIAPPSVPYLLVPPTVEYECPGECKG